MGLKDIRKAVRREKLLRFLESDTAAWKDADHPELGRDAAVWVRSLRRESETKRGKRARRKKRKLLLDTSTLKGNTS